MAIAELPPVNEHGFVLLPEGAIRFGENVDVGVLGRRSRHHMYWPDKAYGETGSIARKFRDHPINKIIMPRKPHTAYHDKYDLTVVEHPELLKPSDAAMADFLDDVGMFTALRKAIGSVKSMDSKLRQGTYTDPVELGLERRAALVESIRHLSVEAAVTTLVPRDQIEYAVYNTLASFQEAPPTPLAA